MLSEEPLCTEEGSRAEGAAATGTVAEDTPSASDAAGPGSSSGGDGSKEDALSQQLLQRFVQGEGASSLGRSLLGRSLCECYLECAVHGSSTTALLAAWYLQRATLGLGVLLPERAAESDSPPDIDTEGAARGTEGAAREEWLQRSAAEHRAARWSLLDTLWPRGEVGPGEDAALKLQGLLCELYDSGTAEVRRPCCSPPSLCSSG